MPPPRNDFLAMNLYSRASGATFSTPRGVFLSLTQPRYAILIFDEEAAVEAAVSRATPAESCVAHYTALTHVNFAHRPDAAGRSRI